jgi:hypothetical protein
VSITQTGGSPAVILRASEQLELRRITSRLGETEVAGVDHRVDL